MFDFFLFYESLINELIFYLNFILQGRLECNCDSVFQLAAYVLQATHGDFAS